MMNLSGNPLRKHIQSLLSGLKTLFRTTLSAYLTLSSRLATPLITIYHSWLSRAFSQSLNEEELKMLKECLNFTMTVSVMNCLLFLAVGLVVISLLWKQSWTRPMRFNSLVLAVVLLLVLLWLMPLVSHRLTLSSMAYCSLVSCERMLLTIRTSTLTCLTQWLSRKS